MSSSCGVAVAVVVVTVLDALKDRRLVVEGLGVLELEERVERERAHGLAAVRVERVAHLEAVRTWSTLSTVRVSLSLSFVHNSSTVTLLHLDYAWKRATASRYGTNIINTLLA